MKVDAQSEPRRRKQIMRPKQSDFRNLKNRSKLAFKLCDLGGGKAFSMPSCSKMLRIIIRPAFGDRQSELAEPQSPRREQELTRPSKKSSRRGAVATSELGAAGR